MDTGIFIGDKIITTSWDKIWNKPTTLSGYGITDAYTQSDADGRFFRYFGYTTDDGDDFMWQKLGTFTYLNAFPDGVTIKRHGYGQVTSFIAGSSRLELYSTHTSSDPNDGNNGIQFRSGWNDDKKSWRMLLDEVNYLHYTDNRYVNKAGDTMTGTLLMSNDSDIYGRSSANSSAAYIIGYRDANISGIVMHDISAANNTKALYIQTNGYDAPSDTGGLAITNDCVTAFGSGDNGSVFRVLNEGDVNLGALFNVAKDGTLTRLGNRIWDAGNDGSGSGLDADLLDGYHETAFLRSWWTESPGYDCDTHNNRPMISFTYSNNAPFNGSFIDVSVNEYGFYLGTSYSHDAPLYYRRHATPSDGGMGAWQQLARVTDNVYSATKLQTPRTIFSKPFDGTGNVTGGAKFTNICIETDNNGNDSGRSSEINNYVGPLQLQQASPNGIHMCVGGGQVGICTTSPKYTLHVDGVIYAKDGFRERSDIRKKKVLNSHTVSLDDMAYADLFDYTLIDDEKEIVRVGTNAHYWLDKLPQVVTKDNDEYLSLNYGVLGTVCALSVSKYVKQLEDRVTLLENKIASLQ